MQSADTQRLRHILDYCQEIKKTINRYGNSYEMFGNDVDYQRSVSFCILQIGELSGGLSNEYRTATSSKMPWASIKGMRNVVVHNYGSVSPEIVWETATNDIPQLEKFCADQLEIADASDERKEENA